MSREMTIDSSQIDGEASIMATDSNVVIENGMITVRDHDNHLRSVAATLRSEGASPFTDWSATRGHRAIAGGYAP